VSRRGVGIPLSSDGLRCRVERSAGNCDDSGLAALCADLARLERLGERGTGTAADLRAFAIGSLAAVQSASAKAPASVRADIDRIAAFYREFHEFAERIEFDPARLETAPESERFS
jgi:hypothetical protein